MVHLYVRSFASLRVNGEQEESQKSNTHDQLINSYMWEHGF